MIAILTGDIVNSVKKTDTAWLTKLKTILNKYGESPNVWEIFRGDSFQLKIQPEKAIWVALHIKATLKILKDIDVRISLGIGEENNSNEKITQANGKAYINSGRAFEELGKKTLIFRSGATEVDDTINLMINLYMLTANNWSTTVAETIKIAMENPTKNQAELAKILGKSQSAVSEQLNRGGYDEFLKLHHFYKNKIQHL